MKSARILALGLTTLVAVAAAPGPTGAGHRGICGITLTSDAAFQQLDRVRSAAAQKICAIYLNTLDVRPDR
jgi:hypothetical protein